MSAGAPGNALPDSMRSLLVRAGVDESQVVAAGGAGADRGDYLMAPEQTVGLLADALRSLHSVNPVPHGAPEPMTSAMTAPLTMASVIDDAAARAGSAAPPPLDAAYRHMDHERLLEVLVDTADALGEFPSSLVVITHGRPEPRTLRCAGAAAIGFVEWELAAVADPHRDLAHAATAVAAGLGPMLVPTLFERYGVRPDPRRIDWWALAQQLTGTAATSAAAATAERADRA